MDQIVFCLCHPVFFVHKFLRPPKKLTAMAPGRVIHNLLLDVCRSFLMEEKNKSSPTQNDSQPIKLGGAW